jgi:hypothetical protein
MKTTINYTLTLIAVCGLFLFVQGCGHTCGPDCDHAHSTSRATGHDDCDGDHTPRYGETLVVFPGHSFAMEIIDEKGTTGLVTAFLTDAHFDPVEVDTQEVRLNFIIDGTPTTFTLTRIETAAGEPATFTLVDMQLATLNCEGWEGEANARVMINGVPFSSRLIQLDGHHGHSH